MLKRQAAALAALLMLCAAASAQVRVGGNFAVPDQKILGAERPVALGKLVRLRVSPPAATPANLISSAYAWKVFDADAATGELVELDDVVELNGSVFFGAGIQPKKLKAMCVCTHLYTVSDGGKVTEAATRTNWLTATVTIGTPAPPSPPAPAPNPPDLPAGTYQLAKAAYQAAVDRVRDPAARTKGAAALARGYRGVASAIAAGTLKDLATALRQTKDANNQALKDAGVDVAAWDDFGNALGDAIYAHYQARRLGTVADLAAAYGEVATGLERVR